MRIKKANAALGTLLLTGGAVLLYLIADEDKGSLYGNPEAQKVAFIFFRGGGGRKENLLL